MVRKLIPWGLFVAMPAVQMKAFHAMPQLPHHIVVAAAQWGDPATASVLSLEQV